ncbi:MAG: ThuA domain-containing protein [Gemmatimonadota bacterium]|nr:ThuA domain-containing protein [Gemmatimonadota bacterium]
MASHNTLVFAGGQIHDYKSAGPAIMDALSECDDLTLTYVEEDLDALAAPNLDAYDLIVFYYTVGDISDAQKNGLLNWVASGKGYAGIHSAADSFRSCPEYRAMVGGHFVTHPKYRDYQVSVVDEGHFITDGLTEFMVRDEQYILDYDVRNHVLCSALHEGGAMPVAWTKSWGEGRVFYLALGHDGDACGHETFRTLLQRGACWAAQPAED